MSAHKVPPRPRQVTTAGVLGVVGSVLLVLSLFDAAQRVRSVEMRSAVEDFLSEPPGNGLGVSTGWVLEMLHGMVLVNGALAAVAAVFAVYVVQRHHGARIGFSIVAVLLLLTAPLSGGVMAMLVAFAATMLWGQPARDWFAGREPAPKAVRRDREEEGATRSWPAPDPASLSSSAPGGTGAAWASPAAETPGPAPYPFGTRPDPRWAPPAADQQPAVPAWAVGTPQDPDRRPGSVTSAAVLTWVFAGLTALGYLLVVVMLMAARQPLVDAIQADPQFESLPLSTNDLLAVLWVMSAVAIFWSVSAFVLAVLVFRRVAWARVGLVVSAAAAMLVSLLAFPFGLLHGLAAATTFALLLGRRSAAWFARRPHDRSAVGPFGPGAGPGPGDRRHAPPYPQSPPPSPQAPPSGKQKPPVW